jgi:hypothetical protein
VTKNEMRLALAAKDLRIRELNDEVDHWSTRADVAEQTLELIRRVILNDD